MNKKTRLERLKQLKYMLDNHHKIFKGTKFDMDNWIKMINPFSKGLPPKTSIEKIPEFCGTAACALGSAALYPPFVKLGLYAGCDEEKDYVFYKRELGYDAGAKFFGISENNSYYLFNPDAYDKISKNITPKDISKHVAILINQYLESK